ncbi:hypothetical protein BJV74DRAFT_799687 [Russula compacta]|nr:hypothetical protein BJV74DRAFT_799687 [Russula compacta]
MPKEVLVLGCCLRRVHPDNDIWWALTRGELVEHGGKPILTLQGQPGTVSGLQPMPLKRANRELIDLTLDEGGNLLQEPIPARVGGEVDWAYNDWISTDILGFPICLRRMQVFYWLCDLNCKLNMTSRIVVSFKGGTGSSEG